MYRFEKLFVWQKGVEACQVIYQLTATFPVEEKFGITSQLRRAAISMPTNIAEGTGDDSDAEMLRFLNYALRSQHEAVSLLRLSVALGVVKAEDCNASDQILATVGRLIWRLKKAIRSDSAVRDESVEADLEHDILLLLNRSDSASQ